MMENFKIEPLKGYGELQFGMPIDDVVEILGQPTNQEEIESAYEDDSHVMVLDFEDNDFSAYFEGNDTMALTNFYTFNEKSELYGAKIFDLNKEQLLELMKENGFDNYIEDTEDGDCITFEELNLDFYFDNNQLVEVFWECQRG